MPRRHSASMAFDSLVASSDRSLESPARHEGAGHGKSAMLVEVLCTLSARRNVPYPLRSLLPYCRDFSSMADDAEEEYFQTVEIFERTYQKFSVDKWHLPCAG